MGPLPNGLFMAYKWGVILTTYTSTGMILQAKPLVAETKNAWMVGEVKI